MSNARELSELAGSYGTGGFVGMKNRIINGAMMIDQRNAGASVTPAANTYTLDRWHMAYGATTASTLSVEQSNTAPPSFSRSTKLTVVSTISSPVSGDSAQIRQYIEGYNIADMNFGAGNASTFTLSFWVQSSVTGTFGGAFKNNAANRCYPFTYVINAVNTWEQKTVTISGDTTGTWETTNSTGITVNFSFCNGGSTAGTAGSWQASNLNAATGCVNLLATNGATFYITGVQLEKGSTATSFDYRPYGTELALCQRYYQQWGGNSGNERLATGFNYSSTQCRVTVPLVVTMRTTPTLTTSAAGDWAVEAAGTTTACTTIVLDQASNKIAATNFNVASGLTGGQGAQIMANATSNSRFNLSAEL